MLSYQLFPMWPSSLRLHSSVQKDPGSIPVVTFCIFLHNKNSFVDISSFCAIKEDVLTKMINWYVSIKTSLFSSFNLHPIFCFEKIGQNSGWLSEKKLGFIFKVNQKKQGCLAATKEVQILYRLDLANKGPSI